MARPPVQSYSVAAVVRMTGLSEHVLRAWERRHEAVVPRRTAGGTRRYTAEDVARLRLLAAAVANGAPIRELAPLSDAELAIRAARPGPPKGPRLAGLFAALEELEVESLERQLGLQLAALGVRAFLDGVAVPFLHEIGARWERGELAPFAEHAASTAVRSVLARAVRAPSSGDASSLVLATPVTELHELGILMAALCAQEHRVRVVYLGCNLEADEIAEAAKRARAEAVGLGIVALDPVLAGREVRALRRRLPAETELWLGGAGAARLTSTPEGATIVSDLAALETRLALLAEPGRRPRPLKIV
jgi:DNA-binding transcriptional MerR regulator/methylmalonyl-CoA mutase cobalamin-binding subunit